jgi:hypothetical protein
VHSAIIARAVREYECGFIDVFRRLYIQSTLKMPARQSARASINRDQASSPPTKSGQRVAKPSGSVMRTSRATRSQSRDLDDKDASKSTRKRTRPRGARQGSVDSVGSNASVDSKGGRKRKQDRTAIATGG